ncbi:MAG: hypothetical protein JSR54_08920, partial [Proteobacteria bacterium]|nr:hypothetical protein [Pseudomonadota bacterium]
LPGRAAPDVVGYFCTHYPVLDGTIRAELGAHRDGAQSTAYIAQGQLMATLFARMARARLQGHERAQPAPSALLARLTAQARPAITISGHNGEVTRALARTVFPGDPEPPVTESELGTSAVAGH